jgi:uncharacterized protein
MRFGGMKRIVIGLVVIVIALFTVFAAACSNPAPPPSVTCASAPTPAEQNAFTVVGTATLAVEPDTARLHVTVSAVAPRPGAAAKAARAKQTKLIAGLTTLGLLPGDIDLSQLSITQIWDYNRQRVTGYSASIRISARTQDFDRLGAMMDAAADAGATDMSSTFEADLTPLKKKVREMADLSPQKKKVREMAHGAAKEKAAQITGALDVSLGRIVAISESNGDGQWIGWGESSVPNAYEVQPSKLVSATTAELQPLTLSISVTYKLA